MEIRNIAIIAHVDHGKTTLVDQLLKQSDTLRDNEQIAERALDSNDLERERGITILAKNTAIRYKDCLINILDTPGHADFGGEVERIMSMVDGVLLVVDAYEGTMPQTRFVLKKALEAKVKPIVVINKVDRPVVRIPEVMDEVLELFMELGADDEQLDFKTVYASALLGTTSLSPDPATQQKTMDPLFDMIMREVPAPQVTMTGGLQFQPVLLDYNDYVGRIGIGRVTRGEIKVNEMVSCCRLDGSIKTFRVQKLFGFLGLHRIEIEAAHAGDIIAIAGLADIGVGETICDIGAEDPLPAIHIDEPTIEMVFGTNTSPFAGREGKLVTASKIEDRLMREVNRDVSLRVTRVNNAEEWVVAGRGELHLSILIETMRREGFELEVSRPHVILKTIDGVECEPYEDVWIETPDDCIGNVIESLGLRRGILIDMNEAQGQTKVHYHVPSRGMIGFMTNFLTMTRGYGIISHTFMEYRPVDGGTVGERNLGVLISIDEGQTTAYALGSVESRGVMFVEPGTNVYEGMIVGEHSRENDLTVNVTRAKQMTNTRSSTKDTTVVLKKPRLMGLEACLDYINDDELVEVTPQSIRLRKRLLTENDRRKAYVRKMSKENA